MIKYCDECYVLCIDSKEDLHFCNNCMRLWGTIRLKLDELSPELMGAGLFVEQK